MTAREKILASNYKIGFITCGGGTRFISNMCVPGGSSQTFLYGKYITDAEWAHGHFNLGIKAVSPKTAELLALSARRNVISLKPNDKIPLGVGCTAALTVDNEREGRLNHAYIAVVYEQNKIDDIFMYHLTFKDGTRVGQEVILADVITDIVNDTLTEGPISCLNEYSKYGAKVEILTDYVLE